MKILNAIAGSVLIIVILTSGCIRPPVNWASTENILQAGEVINGTYPTFPSENKYTLIPKEFPLVNSGTYLIYAETESRGTLALAGFKYTINQTDRFGTTNVEHGWITPTMGEGYLGGTDDNTVINTTFTIPDGATNAKLVFLSTTGGRIKISVSKVD